MRTDARGRGDIIYANVIDTYFFKLQLSACAQKLAASHMSGI